MTEKIKNICPNCKTEFDSSFNFCPNCGQANRALNLRFKNFVSELIAVNLNIDSKITRTLKALIFSPAKLTNEYIDGVRSLYITPIRFYMVISLLYFFVLSITVNKQLYENISIDPDTESAVDSTNSEIGFTEIVDSIESDSLSSTERMVLSKVELLQTPRGRENFLERFQDYTSVGMFVLIPITALLLFVMFYKGTYYMQHLIFAIHLQSLIYIVFTLFNIIGYFFDSYIFMLIEWGLITIIVFLWFKKFYKLGVGKTIWKMFVFSVGYNFLLFLFFLSILGFSFFNM